jgi:hypothetical protein
VVEQISSEPAHFCHNYRIAPEYAGLQQIAPRYSFQESIESTSLRLQPVFLLFWGRRKNMAKSPQLVAAIAKVVKKPEETVRVALRRLHEAELIEVTGRGRGGKDMTPRDAAMLLLAMSMGTMLKDSPATLRDYWNLPQLPTEPHRRDSLGHPPGERPALSGRYFAGMFTRRITPVDTLGMVLTTVIERASERMLFPRPDRRDFMPPPEAHIPVPAEVPNSHLQIRVYSPWRAASMHIRMNLQWRSEIAFGERTTLAEEAFPGEDRLDYVDFVEIRQFSEKAILTIGESLK